MMGMMGGMGGGRSSAGPRDVEERPAGRDHVVLKFAEGDLEVEAEIPAFGPRDSLRYRVTVRRRGGGLVAAADVTLSTSPECPDEGHGSHSALWMPTRERDGVFAFDPSLVRGASYRLVVSVNGVDGRALDPPLRVAHVVRLEAPASQVTNARHTEGNVVLQPLLLLGAGLMLLMMVIVVR